MDRDKIGSAQRLLEEYLEHVENYRSAEIQIAALGGVVVLDVMRYRRHVPRRAEDPEPESTTAAL
jgi:hypothetical protein